MYKNMGNAVDIGVMYGSNYTNNPYSGPMSIDSTYIGLLEALG